MNNAKFFRNIALTAGAAVIGLASFSADAHGVIANYQDNVLPSVTRHTPTTNDTHVRVDRQSVAVERQPVMSGNYQTHMLPSATRHTVQRTIGRQHQNVSADTAMNDRR